MLCLVIGDRVGNKKRNNWIDSVTISGDETKNAVVWSGLPHRKQDCCRLEDKYKAQKLRHECEFVRKWGHK